MRKLIPLILLTVSVNFCFTQAKKIDSLKLILDKTSEKPRKLDVLDTLTKELIRSNSQEQELYLRQYLSLSSDLEQYDLMASKSRFLIQYYIYAGKPIVARQLCDSLLGFKSSFKNESSEAHLLLKRGATYYNKEQLDAAEKDYLRSSELFLKSGDSIFAADALYFSGQVNADRNAFLEAIESYKKAITLYDKLGDDQYALLVGSELTLLYSQNGFTEKSLQERELLLKKAIKNKDYLSYSQLIGQNVSAYYQLGNYDKMSINISEMLKVRDSIDDKSVRDYYNMFTLNYKLRQAIAVDKEDDVSKFKNRLDSLLESTSILQYLETDMLNTEIVYYSYIKDDKKLLPVLKKLLDKPGTNNYKVQLNARERLAALYKKQGKLNKALSLNELNSKIKDSVYNSQKLNAFLYSQAEFENERRLREISEQDAEIQRLESEQKLARNKRNSLIGLISLFFIGIGTILFLRNRQKIKEHAYQNILLNTKVATKTEEINELLTETIQHIKSKERIAENLQKLSNENEGITLKSIIADLKASKADNAKLMLIKQNIEQVNFEFIKKLKNTHPELTKTDIEICSLIRIGLSRKEVANLRNTSLEAVKTSRFRLKKKLNLSANDALDDYVNTL